MNQLVDDLEDRRIDDLEKAIETLNQESSCSPRIGTWPVTTEEVLTEMLTYHGSENKFSYFFETNDPESVHEVWLPRLIRRHIRTGDTFLMTLGKSEDLWIVLFSSPPYIECTVDF